MNKRYKFSNKEIKTIQKFIQTNIDKDIKVHKNNVYECEVATKDVYIGNKMYDYDTELYIKWLQQQPEYIPINFILISILHEVGHIMTYTKAKEKERNVLYGIYAFLNEFNILSTDTLNNKYFNIPDERQATMWGINFYKNNKIKCDKLLNELNIGA